VCGHSGKIEDGGRDRIGGDTPSSCKILENEIFFEPSSRQEMENAGKPATRQLSPFFASE